jgi:Pvc16 N-terminal domain
VARPQAIAATSAALLGLMQDRYPRDQFGTSLEFKLFQSKDFDDGLTEGFSLYLYRVTVSTLPRNMTQRRDANNNRFRPSLPVDLHYLLSPWSGDGETQQRMLGWAMRFLEDLGMLGAGQLNHYVKETDTFGKEEGAEIICDPLALTDYLNVWDKLKPKMPSSMTYLVRMVSLESDVKVVQPLAQTREFAMGIPAS